MLGRLTSLYVFDEGTVTAHRYRDEVLEAYARLFRDAIVPERKDFIFIDDNAGPHRVCIVDDFLEEDNHRMSWPSQSPDLNPNEYAWDGLGRAIGQRNTPPETLQELKVTLLEEWDLLPKSFIDTLKNSMISSLRGFYNSALNTVYLAVVHTEY